MTLRKIYFLKFHALEKLIRAKIPYDKKPGRKAVRGLLKAISFLTLRQFNTIAAFCFTAIHWRFQRSLKSDTSAPFEN